MPLVPFPVVSRAVLTCPPPSFTWSGLDPDEVIGDIEEDYIEEFETVNSIATVGYIISCAEWIYYFVREGIKEEEAIDYEQYLIAHWVWLCELPRRVPPQSYQRRNAKLERRTEYNDAVELALESISNGIGSVRDDETAVDAAFVTQLCEYVLPEKCGYDRWRTTIIGRMKKVFPAGARHYDLVRVARPFFDPDVDVDGIDHEAECSSLFRGDDLVGNKYLPLKEPG